MAVIENAGTSPKKIEQWKRSLQAMNAAELTAQQLVQRSAEHALLHLQSVGATEANCAAMIRSIQDGLFAIHEVAAARGIQLPGYQDPDDAEGR